CARDAFGSGFDYW
nr:immunoglobulin heavy chain junction region [Macaca mulatta]MOV90731.1 immunoglobulin heavy chain junction region [Macaca mulatta]MOW84592.1 immunoglobulin heavy chain junction region [Macaca mulatta]MOX63415.1 immunoglobulin heavy chain junction region [Macaca mulatta]